MLMERAQRLDDIGHSMDIIISAKMQQGHQKIQMASTFPNILTARMAALNQSVMHLGQMLNSLSYKNVLARGYAIVRDADENIISSSATSTQPATIEFADGVLEICK